MCVDMIDSVYSSMDEMEYVISYLLFSSSCFLSLVYWTAGREIGEEVEQDRNSDNNNDKDGAQSEAYSRQDGLSRSNRKNSARQNNKPPPIVSETAAPPTLSPSRTKKGKRGRETHADRLYSRVSCRERRLIES